jgi:hypothetical protein
MLGNHDATHPNATLNGFMGNSAAVKEAFKMNAKRARLKFSA